MGQDIVESTKIIDDYDIECLSPLILPTIGNIHQTALKNKNQKIRLNKEDYITIPPSFISFLVGFIDGDGYIQITKTNKNFITMKMVISLHIDDISTLEYILSVLKVGKINVYKDNRNPCCKLVINKTDLQEVLFPLLIYHDIFFLTETRNDQFNTAMFILNQDLKKYDEIPNIKDITKIFVLPVNAEDYIKLSFFRN